MVYVAPMALPEVPAIMQGGDPIIRPKTLIPQGL
jgi:hypothetical protein